MHSLLFKTASILLCLVAQTWAESSTSSSHLLSTDILYWPVAGVSEPSTLARISYDSSSLKSDLISYSPPQKSLSADSDSEELVRVGLYASTPANGKQWVGTITSLSSLAPKQEQGQGQGQLALRLYVSPSNEIYHVSLAPASGPAAASTTADGPTIEVVPAETGPQPHLNRPVVLSEDGQNPEEVVEKTMFQKYWWVILIITFIAMSGGGEGQ
ncbi:hypothetical protein P168DRAFT_245051 [Aspergillus campestris IBT 28561]|uniref:ER membrane protein complex subunit 10 n=1 Tax=Aspergillus campestris (strain IBT 28561) TaxID=1392248 RepID=A0A2I1CQK9_ASPC2|nr:uncharacterized protein P168DRAFT_245051 [Aspergillus campestris IBT 28561]PKX99905.1 hypothetical protein P168DRAFT_245051 [Aspergillus campestris IBT 28561]